MTSNRASTRPKGHTLDDDGAVLLFPDPDAGVSAVSTAWVCEQGVDDA